MKKAKVEQKLDAAYVGFLASLHLYRLSSLFERTTELGKTDCEKAQSKLIPLVEDLRNLFVPPDFDQAIRGGFRECFLHQKRGTDLDFPFDRIFELFEFEEGIVIFDLLDSHLDDRLDSIASDIDAVINGYEYEKWQAKYLTKILLVLTEKLIYKTLSWRPSLKPQFED